MSNQPSLSGFEFTPPQRNRLFFALRPDVNATSDIGRVAEREDRQHRLRGRRIAAERLHVTLQYLGDDVRPRDAVVFAAQQAAAAVVMPPFDVAFDRLESFLTKPDRVPLVLRGEDGVAGVMMLYRVLGEAMAEIGLGHYVQPHYTPHVTLLYGNRPIAEQPVETIGWTVREFILVRSLYGRGKHIVLGRWPLRTFARVNPSGGS